MNENARRDGTEAGRRMATTGEWSPGDARVLWRRTSVALRAADVNCEPPLRAAVLAYLRAFLQAFDDAAIAAERDYRMRRRFKKWLWTP